MERVRLPGSATAQVPTSGAVTRVGDLPVSVTAVVAEGEDFLSQARVRAGKVAAAGPSRVQVAVADGKVAQAAGVRGVVLSLSGVDSAVVARAKVGVDYGQFAQLYGANYGERLRVVALPACVLSTPQRMECQRQTPLASVNRAGVLSAEVVLGDQPAKPPTAGAQDADGAVLEPTVIGITSFPASDAGTFTETSLSPAYSWSAGGQGGSFSWGHPLKVPESLGGPSPDLSIGYDSGSVDAQTLAQNGQTSWIGEGWDLQTGFIERSYRPCAQDGHATGDLCWFSPHNATLVFQGRSNKLVRDSATGVWKTDDDNGLRVEQLFDGSLGNGDNDGEHWRVTTLDGTQYLFGKHKRYAADTQVTNSVQTVLVYGDDAGEPCYVNGVYAYSYCPQGYRWNLDYVVDARGNSMTYFYSKFTGYYGKNNNNGTAQYVISSTLDHIDYGTRAGSEASAAAPMQVVFTKTDRCINSCAWPSDFPDTPGDLYCTSSTSCPNLTSPAFWSRHNLSSVHTQVRKADGSGYRKVDQWDLTHVYPSTGDYISPSGDDTSPNLWLQTLTHTGYAEDGATTLAEPTITFGGTQMLNRVDWGNDIGVAPYVHYRLTSILNGVGGQTVVAYSQSQCPYRSLKPAPGFNPYRCFPQYHKPQQAAPGYGWFNKYVVNSVTEKDLTAAQSPDETWAYAYSVASSTDPSLWGHDFNETVQLDYRSWPLWRGYTDVTTTHGPAGGTQTVSKALFHRGMDGDSVATSDNQAMVWEGRRAYLTTPVGTPEVTAPIGALGGKCLDAAGYGTANGTAVQLYDCHGGGNQTWLYNLDTASSHVFSFKNPVSGRCLDVSNSGTANGTKIQLWDCNGTAAQKWRFAPDGSLKNPNSGKCLDTAGGGAGNGTVVQLWDCTGWFNQVWRARDDGSLFNPQVGRCVDVNGGGTANGTKIQSWTCNNGIAQQWTYSPSGSSLKNPNSGRCLDVTNSGTTNGSLVQLYSCNDAGAQIWVPQADGTLKNPNSGRCLDALNPPAPGNQLVIWDCNGGITQQWAHQITDSFALHGKPREVFTMDGSTVLGSSIHTYSVSQTGLRPKPITGGQDIKAFRAREVDTKTRTWIQATSSWRWTNVQARYDEYGLVNSVFDYGDTAVSNDDTCTRTVYNRNTDSHLVALVKRTFTTRSMVDYTSSPCISPLSSTGYLSGTHYYFDGNATDVTPTQGLVTKTDALAAVSGGYPNQTLIWRQSARASYDSNGRVTEAFDALERRTTTAYVPPSGAPVTSIAVTGPMGAGWTTTTTVDPGHGSPKAVTDINGKVTTAQYDPLGRLTKVWLDNRSTAGTPDRQYTYTPTASQPSWIRTQALGPNGNQISSYQIFDGRLRARQTQTITEAGKRSINDVRYDGRGLVVTKSVFHNSASAPSPTLATFNDADVARQFRYDHDNLARQVKEKLYSLNALQWETQTVYEGDRVGVIPPAGGTPTQDVLDAHGRVVQKRQYSGTPFTGAFDATGYAHDRLGRLTKVTDPAGNEWTYTYDLRGRQTQTVDPDAGATTKTYDDAGQLTATTDARGQTLVMEYDNLGRKTKVRDGSATGPLLSQWVFDTVAKGQLAESIRHVGSDQYKTRVTSRDDGYRPLHSEIEVPNPTLNGALAATYAYDHTYKPDGSPATVALPGAGGLPAETLTHTYSDTGFAQTMTGAWTGGSQTYVADTDYRHDRLVSAQYLGEPGSQVKLSWQHYAATRKLSVAGVDIETSTPGSFTTKYSTDYAWDAAGNMTYAAGNTDGTPDQVECFGHDYLRRLTKAWTQSAIGSGCLTPQRAGADPYWREWTFDTIGNRLSQIDKDPGAGDTTWTYTHPTSGPGAVRPHALTQVTATGPLAGTPTRTFSYDNAGNTTSATTATGAGQTLTWDKEGRLQSVVEGADTTSYVYEAAGNRLVARTPSKTTLYLPDGTELDLPSGGGSVLGTRYYAGVAVRDASGLKWTCTNHQGTSIVQIDAVTLESVRRRMMPYGEPRGPQPSEWMGTKGYVGGTKDHTGYTHLGAREYDPSLGRFISVDPIMDLTDPQQWHAYTYANNSPVTFSDPSGLYFFEDVNGGGQRGHGTPTSGGKTKTKVTGKSSASAVGDLTLGGERPDVLTVNQMIGGLYCGSYEMYCGRFEDLWQFDQETVLAKLWCYNNPRTCGNYIKESNAWVGALVAELTGYADAKACVQGSMGGCAWTAVGLVPVGKLKVLAKLGQLGDVFKVADDAPWRTFCSFSAETEVLMADGTTKPIGKVKVGDKVLATDPETGEQGQREVTHLWIHDDELIDLQVGDGTVTTTDDHPFWNASDQQWQGAAEIDPGELLLASDGTLVAAHGLLPHTSRIGTAYNLTVADIHTYYVLAGTTPVLVHNTGCDEWADAFIAVNGGEGFTFRPPSGGRVFPEGTYAHQPPGEAWFHHTVVVRGDKVFDQFNPNGISIPEYKAQWGDMADEIEFGF